MLIFKCLTCKTDIQLIGVHDVRHHLNAHRIAGKLSFPLRCGQSPDCKSTMGCIDAFMKHYTKFYFTEIVPVGESFRQPQEILPGGISCLCNLDVISLLDVSNIDDTEGAIFSHESHNNKSQVSFSEKIQILKEKMKTAAFNLISELRAKGNVPFNVSVNVLSNLTSFVDLIVNETSEAIQDEFVKVTDVETLSDNILFAKDNLMELKTFIPRFATEYRIRQLYDQHPNFVRPQSIVLGFRDEHALVKVEGGGQIKSPYCYEWGVVISPNSLFPVLNPTDD